jgi:hypothetical protein
MLLPRSGRSKRESCSTRLAPDMFPFIRQRQIVAKPGDIDGSEGHDITLSVGGQEVHFKGQPYLLHFAMLNFLFSRHHPPTACCAPAALNRQAGLYRRDLSADIAVNMLRLLNKASPWVVVLFIVAGAEVYSVGLMGTDRLRLNNEVAGFKFTFVSVFYAVH